MLQVVAENEIAYDEAPQAIQKQAGDGSLRSCGKDLRGKRDVQDPATNAAMRLKSNVIPRKLPWSIIRNIYLDHLIEVPTKTPCPAPGEFVAHTDIPKIFPICSKTTLRSAVMREGFPKRQSTAYIDAESSIWSLIKVRWRASVSRSFGRGLKS